MFFRLFGNYLKDKNLLDEAQLQVKKIMTAPDGSPVEEDFADE